MTTELAAATGLSSYLLQVLYDFFGHEHGGHKHKHRLRGVLCRNTEIVALPGRSAQRKATVLNRERALRAEVRAGRLSAAAKDAQLVHEFVGSARCECGHYVYVYYCGPPLSDGAAQREMALAANWRLVPPDHLALFHSRWARRATLRAQWPTLSATRVPEDARGNLGLDARFPVLRWLHTKQAHALRPTLEAARDLFTSRSDYLIVSQRAMRAQEQKKRQRSDETSVVDLINAVRADAASDEEEEASSSSSSLDPYEVPRNNEALRRVSKEEYEQAQQAPIDASIRFDCDDFVGVSRAAYLGEGPPLRFVHDPIRLISAVAIATNLEGVALRAGSRAAREQLQIVENNDRARVLDALAESGEARNAIHEAAQEFVFSLKAVDHATRELPAPIGPILRGK